MNRWNTHLPFYDERISFLTQKVTKKLQYNFTRYNPPYCCTILFQDRVDIKQSPFLVFHRTLLVETLVP